MADQVRVIEVRTIDGDVKKTADELRKLGHEVEVVEKNIDSATDSTSKYSGEIKKSSAVVEEIDSKTRGLGSALLDVKDSAKKAGTAFKGAFAASVIGVAVIAIGLIVDNWSAIVGFINQTNAGLERKIKLLDQAVEFTNADLALNEKQQKLNELEGKSNEALQKQKIKLLEQQKELNDDLAINLQTQLDALQIENKRVTAWERIKIEAIRFFNKSEGAALEAKSRIKDDEQTLEIQKRLTELKEKQVDIEIALFNAKNTGTTGTSGGEDKETSRSEARAVSEIQGNQALAEVRLQEVDIEKQVTDGLEEQAARRRRIRQAETEFQQAKNDVIFNSAQRLSNALFLLGEENKGLAVAGIIVDQIASAAQSIQSLTAANAKAVAAFPLTGGQPFVAINTVSTIAGIAAGAAAAAKAISEIGGGGAAGSPSVPGGISAPSFNVVGQSPINQLAQTIQGQDQPIQAYVVGSNVTSQQEADRNIVETATIG